MDICNKKTKGCGICNPKSMNKQQSMSDRLEKLDNKLLQEVYGYLPSGKHRVGRQMEEIKFIKQEIKRELETTDKALKTIEAIVSLNDPDEKNRVLQDIYKIAHAYADNSCYKVHEDWRKESREIYKKLKNL